jgi:hypothetical protein
LYRSYSGDLTLDLVERDYGYVESVGYQHGLIGICGIYLYAVGRPMCHGDHHDSDSEYECHADVYAIGTLLCGIHTGNLANDLAERDFGDVESVDHQHSYSRIGNIYLYAVGRPMRYRDDHDDCSECQSHANLYPVRALLCGIHAGNFTGDLAERHHRNMESFYHQYSFCGIDNIYLYAVGRSMWHNDDDDGSSERQCYANLYTIGPLLCGSHPGVIADDVAEWHHGNLESFDHQHSFSRIYSLHIYTLSW